MLLKFFSVDNRYRGSGGVPSGDSIVKSRGMVASASGLNMGSGSGISSPERALLGGSGGSPRSAVSYSNDRIDINSPGAATETMNLSAAGSPSSTGPPRNIFDDL